MHHLGIKPRKTEVLGRNPMPSLTLNTHIVHLGLNLTSMLILLEPLFKKLPGLMEEKYISFFTAEQTKSGKCILIVCQLHNDRIFTT